MAGKSVFIPIVLMAITRFELGTMYAYTLDAYNEIRARDPALYSPFSYWYTKILFSTHHFMTAV
jgi:hypothetical protein